MTRICIQDWAHELHTVGKQNKRRSLLEGIYNLNRHADKRCYYLHFTDGDQDTLLIWCAKGQTDTRGGREGASRALELGYQVALTVNTLPHRAHCKSRVAGFVSACGWDKQLPLELLQPLFCPHSWFLPSSAKVPVYPGSVFSWLAPQKRFFWSCLADVVLMHIWHLFLCFNIMVWKLFTLDVYSCCWI